MRRAGRDPSFTTSSQPCIASFTSPPPGLAQKRPQINRLPPTVGWPSRRAIRTSLRVGCEPARRARAGCKGTGGGVRADRGSVAAPAVSATLPERPGARRPGGP